MQLIYSIICKIYCLISTQIENIFFRKFIVENDLQKNGFFVLRNEINNIFNDYESKKIETNKYLRKLIYSEDQIDELLYKIFIEKNLIEKITKLTGFNYSVDFFTAYETISVPTDEKKSAWYANHAHKDKPFSKNTLKLIIPIEKIEDQNGPMEILNINDTKAYEKKKISLNFFKFSGNPNDVFMFKPNLCIHRAGIPEINKNRVQMMLQLNPATNWCFNENIYNFQNIIEPKFPLIRYFFNKKSNFS